MKSSERVTGAERFLSLDRQITFIRIEVQVIKTLIASYFDIVKVISPISPMINDW